MLFLKRVTTCSESVAGVVQTFPIGSLRTSWLWYVGQGFSAHLRVWSLLSWTLPEWIPLSVPRCHIREEIRWLPAWFSRRCQYSLWTGSWRSRGNSTLRAHNLRRNPFPKPSWLPRSPRFRSRLVLGRCECIGSLGRSLLSSPRRCGKGGTVVYLRNGKAALGDTICVAVQCGTWLIRCSLWYPQSPRWW